MCSHPKIHLTVLTFSLPPALKFTENFNHCKPDMHSFSRRGYLCLFGNCSLCGKLIVNVQIHSYSYIQRPSLLIIRQKCANSSVQCRVFRVFFVIGFLKKLSLRRRIRNRNWRNENSPNFRCTRQRRTLLNWFVSLNVYKRPLVTVDKYMS